MRDLRTNSFKQNLLILTMAMVFIMAISCVGVSAITVKNGSAKVNSSDGVNVRKTASTESAIATTATDNAKLTLLAVEFKSKSSTKASKKWYKVKVNGKTGYIRADLVDSQKYTAVDAKVTEKANYRSGAGTDMACKGSLKKGAKVKVLLKATPEKSTAGSSSTWYMIKVDGKKYYASSKYFKLIESSSTDKSSSDKSTSDKSDKDKKTDSKDDKKEDSKQEDTGKVKFTLTNVTHPESTHTEGKTFSLSGKITASEKMTKLYIGITDDKDSWVNQVIKEPKSKTFDISSVDSAIKFGILAAGKYKYTAAVTAGNTTKTVFSYSFTVKNSTKKTLTDEIVTARINELLDALQAKYFTSDKKVCYSSTGATCNVVAVLEKNSVVRNLLNKTKGGKDLDPSLMPHHYDPDGIALTKGYSCCGFASFAAWYVAADSINDDVTYRAVKIGCQYNKATIQKYARVGDVLRSSGHSFMIVSIDKDGCNVTDSNWGYTCLVSLHKIPWDYYSKVTISRASNRADN